MVHFPSRTDVEKRLAGATEMNGYPNNARLLLRKISLAWVATDPDPAERSAQLANAIRPVMKDLEITELHISE